MSCFAYPLGVSALHPDWPDARFNVSGMFVYHKVLIDIARIVEHRFDCRIPVESVHGAPGVPWNAGRPSSIPFSPGAFKSVLHALHDLGIGCYLTFTNHLVEKCDLGHPGCNEMLDCISERLDMNGVIVVSDLLSEYIAASYPGLRQVASVIKVTLENGRGRADYYRSLGSRFHRYVVHPDDCLDVCLMDQLDRDKAEILVNENCAPDCPNRARHYETYARWQKAVGAPERQRIQREMDRLTAGCPSALTLTRLDHRQRTRNLSRTELKSIYDMGFRHFKIQGRANSPFLFLYDLTRFLLDPEVVAPLVFKGMCPRFQSR